MNLSTIVRAEDDFKGLSPQDRAEERDIQVNSSGFDGIFEAYKEDMEEAAKEGSFIPRYDNKGVHHLLPYEVDKEYIRQFMRLIKPHQFKEGFSEVFNFHLETLIYRCSDTSFNLDLSEFNENVRIGLGGVRRKRIKIAGERLRGIIGSCLEEGALYIKGDVGCPDDSIGVGSAFGRSCLVVNGNVSKDFEEVGEYMESGKIHIRGNCYAGTVGFGMRGGRIIIDGDCTSEIGSSMWEGSITIRGRATGILGENMRARGRIYVQGESEPTIGENCRGTVYYNGKLFIDKGKRFLG